MGVWAVCYLAAASLAFCGNITLRASSSISCLNVKRSYTIPPGHDAWVEGNQPFVAIEVMSADVYAKP